MGILKIAYIWVLFLYPFSHSMSFGWGNSPLTFKAIVDMYVLIAILLITLDLFLLLFYFLLLLFFSAYRSSFSICCKAGLVLLNSLSFCLSVKVLISPSNLNESLAGQSNLGWRFFPFIRLSISCHSLLACRVSVEKSADNLIGVPLYVICFFSLAAFKIFSLSLILVSLINICFRYSSLSLFYMVLVALPGFE